MAQAWTSSELTTSEGPYGFNRADEGAVVNQEQDVGTLLTFIREFIARETLGLPYNSLLLTPEASECAHLGGG